MPAASPSAIGIPHYVLDYESRFKRRGDRAISPTATRSARRRSRASSATVQSSSAICSRLARELGARGARHRPLCRQPRRLAHRPSRALVRAADAEPRPELLPLSPPRSEQLDFLRFPLGDLDQGRRPARSRAEFGLAIADKPDSQDICFVPNGRYAEVIERLKPNAARPGAIVHLDGRVLGEHEGVLRYTVGQRKGLGISGGRAALCRRARRRERPRHRRPARGAQRCPCRPARSQLDRRRSPSPTCRPRASRSPSACARPAPRARPACSPTTSGGYEVELVAQGEEGVSPGQACVFYDACRPRQARVLGGGVIKSATASRATRGVTGDTVAPLAEAIRG
jgi:tRNA-specific 2-thiouridylase